MADPITNKSVFRNLTEEFKAATIETRLAMAKEIFKDDPVAFVGEALNFTALQARYSVPTVPKEIVEMDDILTQQVMSTYREYITPLIILSDKN
jgi:hypothetical protein